MEPCGTLDHHKMKLFAIGQKDSHNLIIENFSLDSKISFLINSP